MVVSVAELVINFVAVDMREYKKSHFVVLKMLTVVVGC